MACASMNLTVLRAGVARGMVSPAGLPDALGPRCQPEKNALDDVQHLLDADPFVDRHERVLGLSTNSGKEGKSLSMPARLVTPAIVVMLYPLLSPAARGGVEDPFAMIRGDLLSADARSSGIDSAAAPFASGSNGRGRRQWSEPPAVLPAGAR